MKNEKVAKVTCGNIMAWANKYSEVKLWLSHIQKKKESALFLYRFCEWAHKTPTELLALKENDAKANNAEKLLDKFIGDEIAGFKTSKKFNTAIQVKSFFKWNYRSLEKASGILAYEKIKPYNALNKEGLRKLYNRAANPRDRALIPFITCTGIAKETLTNLTWGHLEDNWENKELPCIQISPELLKGHGKGKYAGVKQITFLTHEAKRTLIDYHSWIQDKLARPLTSQDKIWHSAHKPYEPMGYKMLGNAIIALSGKAKVPFTAHDGRRWVNTALESIGISTNWARKIRGRKVKGEENPYSRPNIEALRAKYREAVNELQFTSETDTSLDQRVKDLEAFKASLTPEQKEKAAKAGYRFMRKKKHKPEKACEDGKHCQRVASEAELPALLKDGWHASIVLPSGKIVVER